MRIQQDVLRAKLKAAKMSWAEHLERGHTPFRRDCRLCQEASARGRMHSKVKHPRAGVMSLDVTGPYKKGKDIDGEAKFMLIGTYTWLRPPMRKRQQKLMKNQSSKPKKMRISGQRLKIKKPHKRKKKSRQKQQKTPRKSNKQNPHGHLRSPRTPED